MKCLSVFTVVDGFLLVVFPTNASVFAVSQSSVARLNNFKMWLKIFQNICFFLPLNFNGFLYSPANI